MQYAPSDMQVMMGYPATKLAGLALASLSLLLGACELLPTPAEEPQRGEVNLLPTRIIDAWVVNEVTKGDVPPGTKPDFSYRPAGGHLIAMYPDPGQIRVYDSSRELIDEKQHAFAYTHSFAVERGLVLAGYDWRNEQYKVAIVDATLSEEEQFSFSTSKPDLFPKIFRLAEVGTDSYVLLIVRRTGTTPANVLAAFSKGEGLLWVKNGNEVAFDSQFSLSDVAPNGQGGFVSVGYYWPSGPVSTLVGFDSHGTVQWQQSYTARRSNKLTEVARLPNGEYLLTGQNQGEGEVHGWYLQVDGSGSEVWNSDKLWTEEAKRESLVSLGDYNIHYVHSASSKLYVVGEDYGFGEIMTFEIDESTFLQRYQWPFRLASGSTSCYIAYLRPTDEGKLAVLAKCDHTERLGRMDWRSTLKTVYFTLQ